MGHEASEMPWNIFKVCGSCVTERLTSWQEHHKELRLQVGDFVKVALSIGDSEQTEHMWVEIKRFPCNASDPKIEGELRNDSVLCSWLTYGTKVTFQRTEISDYCKDGDFDEWKPWGREVHHEG